MKNKLDEIFEILVSIGFSEVNNNEFGLTHLSILIDDVKTEYWFKKLVKFYNRESKIINSVSIIMFIFYSDCVVVSFLDTSNIIKKSEFDYIFADFLRDRKLNLILD